uniref:Leucine rich repeat protein n=1 Tax=Mimivirus LCMiAC02 TaxID=2506609 RepID=A0A481Z2H2_9VIRU|nr:MAG: hypothetical protein LCMiAC02_05840 [Mimivirus LCMiAC02]
MNYSVSTFLKNNRNTKNDTLNISRKSLDKIPEELKDFVWIKKLYIRKNAITSISTSDFPKHINLIDISFNRIIKINSSMLTMELVVLKVQSNEIEEFYGKEYINLKKIDLSHNKIKDSDKIILNIGLKKLNISDNRLDKLPKIPGTLKSLNFSHNNISEINKTNLLPKSLKKLYGENNGMILFDTIIPIDIHTINFEGNRLSEFIDISNTNIVDLNLGNNCLKYLPNSEKIPLSLKKLDISNNFIANVPNQLRNRDNLIIIFNDDQWDPWNPITYNSYDNNDNDDNSWADIFETEKSGSINNKLLDGSIQFFKQEDPIQNNFNPNWWKNITKQHIKTQHMTYNIPVTNTISL